MVVHTAVKTYFNNFQATNFTDTVFRTAEAIWLSGKLDGPGFSFPFFKKGEAGVHLSRILAYAKSIFISLFLQVQSPAFDHAVQTEGQKQDPECCDDQSWWMKDMNPKCSILRRPK